MFHGTVILERWYTYTGPWFIDWEEKSLHRYTVIILFYKSSKPTQQEGNSAKQSKIKHTTPPSDGLLCAIWVSWVHVYSQATCKDRQCTVWNSCIEMCNWDVEEVSGSIPRQEKSMIGWRPILVLQHAWIVAPDWGILRSFGPELLGWDYRSHWLHLLNSPARLPTWECPHANLYKTCTISRFIVPLPHFPLILFYIYFI